MGTEAGLRDLMCEIARSIHARGLTHGSSGNLSARLPDGGYLVTPGGSSLGRLVPADLSRLDASGKHIAGKRPTKEVPLHMAFYETRPDTGAVVHLHSPHAVALSLLTDVDEDDLVPPLTPYSLMLLGRVKLLPFFVPGDAAIGMAIRALEGGRTAVVLANHGPVVAGKDLVAAANAMEELEAGARLDIMTRGLPRRPLSETEIAAVADAYGTDR